MAPRGHGAYAEIDGGTHVAHFVTSLLVVLIGLAILYWGDD